MNAADRGYPDSIPHVQRLRPLVDDTCGFSDYEAQRRSASGAHMGLDYDPREPGRCVSARAVAEKLAVGGALDECESRLLSQLDSMRCGQPHPYPGIAPGFHLDTDFGVSLMGRLGFAS